MRVHILHSDNVDMQLTKDSMETNICSCQLINWFVNGLKDPVFTQITIFVMKSVLCEEDLYIF